MKDNARTWHFAGCELDELRHELRVKGVRVDLESKPLDLLLQLVMHAGEVVTKEELLESVWNGSNVVEGSLATAISKLRKALGDGDPPVIINIPRIGYRLGVPVVCKNDASPAMQEFDLKPGDPVPLRDQWRLCRSLSASPGGAVWLAEHPKTREMRVFKFAWDGAHLKMLKREATLSRYLADSAAHRPEFVRTLEWNFETLPFFLESEYSGMNLLEWADGQGRLSQVALETRLGILCAVAQATAIAHDLGVLHRDLKPANILVTSDSEGAPRIKVADFGIASLLEPARLAELRITNLGFTETQTNEDRSRSGTLLYIAPEVLRGQSSTASADVYALGVMLYQLVAGDLQRPLSAGWESDIDDPLLREDIAAAACGDALKRLNSAADLANRLQTIEGRRQKRRELELAESRTLAAEKKLAESRARRPWIIAAAAALVIGIAISLVLYRRAARESAVATAMNQFLSVDLLAQNDPLKTGDPKKPLVDAVNEAASHIDAEFKSEPAVAARLHRTIAKALDSRFDYVRARPEYDRAAELFLQAEGSQSQDAVRVRLQAADMEARSNAHGSAARAKSLLDAAEASLGAIRNPAEDLKIQLLGTRGVSDLAQNRNRPALDELSAALRLSEASSFDPRTRLRIQQRVAFCYIRLGNAGRAEALLRELVEEYSKLDGHESPNVLEVRMNLTEALLGQHKFAGVIQEANLIYPALARKVGADHELTLQVLSTRAAAEGNLARWDDAVRDDLAVYALSLRKRGPAAFLSIGSLSDAGLSQCKAARFAEGEANAGSAFRAGVKYYGPQAPLTGGTAYTYATCLIGLKRFDEASRLLKNIDVPAVVQLSGDPSAGASIALAQAQIAFQRRDYLAARSYVNAAAPVFDQTGADASDRQMLQKLRAGIDQAISTKASAATAR